MSPYRTPATLPPAHYERPSKLRDALIWMMLWFVVIPIVVVIRTLLCPFTNESPFNF